MDKMELLRWKEMGVLLGVYGNEKPKRKTSRRMVQRLAQERTFLPDKWVNVKGFEDRKKAESLFESLT